MKTAFIGGGNMGEAMLSSLLSRKICTPADISVSDVSNERRDYLKQRYEVTVTESNRDAASGKDIVVLAIKPQNMTEVMSSLKGYLKPEQLVISIAAGTKIGTLSEGLEHRRIVRVMPNTPAQVGSGMSGWTATPEVTAEQRESVKAILGAMGEEIYFDDEKYLDMVTAVSASGPAYFFLMAESMIDAAKAIGLSQEEAEKLVSQTMLGAAQMVKESGKAPSTLRENVTSRGGTTERALAVFNDGGFNELVKRAIEAAYARAREMGSQG
jgi:pyrroline-5-carboxylate reductase